VTIFTPDQRKVLIDKLRPIYDKSLSQFENNGYPAKAWLAWLESLQDKRVISTTQASVIPFKTLIDLN